MRVVSSFAIVAIMTLSVSLTEGFGFATASCRRRRCMVVTSTSARCDLPNRIQRCYQSTVCMTQSNENHNNNNDDDAFDSDQVEKSSKTSALLGTSSKVASIAALLWTATSTVAMAESPDWGIFEGRIGSLLHPLTMGSLFVYSIYTAFLGFQWRRQRTIGTDINDLKASLPDLKGSKTVREALAAAKSTEEVDQAYITKLTAALSVDEQIKALQDERKALSSANLRERHYSQGALIAFIGTAFAIEGPLNTYARAGKLFPGPHLYAGAGLVVLWALAAACVPAMQKGSDTARSIHIGANVAGMCLFAWQVQSGIPILLKVIEKTSWP